MSELPIRGHFRYLRFKTFSTTSRTPQCEVFCPLLSSSAHSGVPEDSNYQLFQVLGFTPTLGQRRGATPTIFSIGKHERIRHWHVSWMQLRDSSESPLSILHNDISMINIFRPIINHDHGNFIAGWDIVCTCIL